MSVHTFLDDPARERAALHALGSLAPEDALEYETHLSVCDACRIEVEAMRRVTSDLLWLAPEADPPAGMRERLLARARQDAAAPPGPAEATVPDVFKEWMTEQARSGMAYALATDAAWEPTGVPGVETRRLFVDTARERVTMLVRMSPGAAYPPHRHGGTEECYVIEGDLRAGESIRLRAGDYKVANAGSVDPVQWTETGCLLLIISSLHDEIIEAAPRAE